MKNSALHSKFQNFLISNPKNFPIMPQIVYPKTAKRNTRHGLQTQEVSFLIPQSPIDRDSLSWGCYGTRNVQKKLPKFFQQPRSIALIRGQSFVNLQSFTKYIETNITNPKTVNLLVSATESMLFSSPCNFLSPLSQCCEIKQCF